MQDFLHSTWSRPYYDSLCRSRPRSPLKIQGTVEQRARIYSVTNVHRKYLLYSSESRCVHLFQEKVTKYVRPVRRCRPEKVRCRDTDSTVYSPPPNWAKNSEASSDHALLTQRPSAEEQLLSRDYIDVKSTRSRSCHSYLNVDFSPDFTSPRFVRPCKMNKDANGKVEEECRRKLPAIEMKPHCEVQLMDIRSAKYVEEFKHFIKHYLSEKKTERLEGSTLLMDTLSLIMSTISPYINRVLYVVWRVKCLADKVFHLYIDYNLSVK